MPTATSTLPSERPGSAPKPLLSGRQSRAELLTIRAFLLIPFAVLAAAVPVFWGGGVSWLDLAIGAGFYTVSTLGITVGYHRYFTHGAFKARRALRVALALAGGLAAQGPVIGWVADHRRHHAFSDRDGDPHSPWLFGTSPIALARGFWHAHMGWLFGRDKTNVDRFAPDLAADRGLRIVDRLFPLWVALSVTVPAVIGGVITLSWWGALTAFLWAGLARISFQHHVTWSVNSICHFVGRRRFNVADESRNVWWLAAFSLGEAWHHNHHAFPSSAFHGLKRSEVDVSAWVIRGLERLGLVWKVVRVSPELQARKLAG